MLSTDTPDHLDRNSGSTVSDGPVQQAWADHSENPFNWPERKKWQIFVVAVSVSFLVGLNATAIVTPSHEIAEQFHLNDDTFQNSFWPVTVWTTAAALGPMLGLPLLENFGMRTGYLIVYLLFTIFIIPQALASNFATLLVARTIAGALGGILQNAPDPLITDMWLTDAERNLPVTLYGFALVGGVTLGPPFGAIASQLNWRWIFYIQLIIYGALIPLLLLVFSETRGPVLLARYAKRDPGLQKEATETKRPPITTLFSDAIIRPAHLLCTEPVVFSLTLWSAFCFGIVFISTQSVAQTYSTNYHFTDGETGLIQLALFVGEVLGFFACLPQNSYYQRSAARNPIEPGVPIPEARLPLSIPTSLIGLAGGLFWYAWTSYPFLNWILPTVGLGLVGFSVMVIITSVSMYITDAYNEYAGSAIAAVAFGENMFAAWLPLATKRMYTVLGFQWASSVLGFAGLALTLAPIVLLFKGESVRKNKTEAVVLTSKARAKAATVSARAHFRPGPAQPIISSASLCVGIKDKPSNPPTDQQSQFFALVIQLRRQRCAQSLSATLDASCPVAMNMAVSTLTADGIERTPGPGIAHGTVHGNAQLLQLLWLGG